MSKLTAGVRLRGVGSTTEVIVVRGPGDDVDLTCAGAPMVALNDPKAEAAAGAPVGGDGPTILIGKRYVADGVDIELLCTKAGPGPLAVGETVLQPKTASALPASD